MARISDPAFIEFVLAEAKKNPEYSLRGIASKRALKTNEKCDKKQVASILQS